MFDYTGILIGPPLHLLIPLFHPWLHNYIMSELDFNILANANAATTTPLGLVHHQSRLDVFIIKAFQLLSNGTILDSNGFNSVAPSPQPVAALIKTASMDSHNSEPLVNNNNTHISPKQLEVSRPGNSSSNTTPGSVKNESVSDTPSPQVFTTRAHYIPVFQKIAAVYNATLSSTTGRIDEKSTSPKSAIELLQRLHQIIREMSLSYESSPYSSYFIKLTDNMWQIRSDADLQSDQLWQLVTQSILAVYNAETEQLIAPQNNRGKKGNNSNSTANYPQALSTTSSPNNSGASVDGPAGATTTETTPTSLSSGSANGATASRKKASANNTQEGPKKVAKKKYNRKKNAALKRELAAAAAATTINPQFPRHSTSGVPEFTLGLGDSNSTLTGQDEEQQLPSMALNMDPSLPQIIQRRLQNISQDSGSRGGSGYYTQPTSPGSDVNSFEFGLATNDFDTNDSNIVFNSANVNNPTDTLSSNNNATGSQTITTNPNILNPALWKRRSLGALVGTMMEEPDSVEELLQFSNNMRNKQFPLQQQRTGMDILGQPSQGTMQVADAAIAAIDDNIQENKIQDNQEAMMVESVSKLLNQSYGSLLDEKDMRISQLEKELEMQRNETQWLRKMLIEDLGCVRSLLTNARG